MNRDQLRIKCDSNWDSFDNASHAPQLLADNYYVCVRVYTMSCVSAFVCINGYVRIRYAFCVSVYNVHVHSMMIESALYN